MEKRPGIVWAEVCRRATWMATSNLLRIDDAGRSHPTRRDEHTPGTGGTSVYRVLLHVGDEVVETVKLDPCPGWTCAGYPDYTFTWRVTRLPDARVDLRSVLDEAMHRSDARSELEVITTGLRYLRAPSPRKIEPNAVDPSPER